MPDGMTPSLSLCLAPIQTIYEKCYITLISTHACMQQIHLFTIKYLVLLMLKKRLETTNFPSYITSSNNASEVPFEFLQYS